MSKIIVALDYGSKNIGIAWSPDGIFSFPVGIIKKSKLQKDVESILEIVSQKSADLIVLGYPFNQTQTDSTKRVDEFLEVLKESTSIPVELEDERMTSVEVRRIGHELGKSDKKMRDKKDAFEAQLILTRYLERTTVRGFDEPLGFA